VTAAILVSIAIYLAIAGFIHVLTSPDATAAVVHDISLFRAHPPATSTLPVPPRTELASHGSSLPGSSRKCMPGKARATACGVN
jgi:hypothetical protein